MKATVITADGRFYGATTKVQKKSVRHRERAKSDMLTNKAGGLRRSWMSQRRKRRTGGKFAPLMVRHHRVPLFFPLTTSPLQVWKQRCRNTNVVSEGGGGVRSEILTSRRSSFKLSTSSLHTTLLLIWVREIIRLCSNP